MRACRFFQSAAVVGLAAQLSSCSLMGQPGGVSRDETTSAGPASAVATSGPPPGGWMFTSVRPDAEEIGSGVLRIDAASCEPAESASGTGFFVAQDVVVTAAHVVADASFLTLRGTNGTARGSLIMLLPERDVALIRVEPSSRSNETLHGYVFQWADAPPRVGDDVRIVGYPAGLPLNWKSGRVTSTDGSADVGGISRSGLLVYDAQAIGGNSGGPVLNERDQVVGLVTSGFGRVNINHAIPTSQVFDLIEAYRKQPIKQRLAACRSEAVGEVTVTSVHPEAPVIAQALNSFVQAVNAGLVSEILDQDVLVTGSYIDDLGGANGFSERYDAHRLGDVELQSVGWNSVTTDKVRVKYRDTTVDETSSVQMCLDYTSELTYSLENGAWQISAEKVLAKSLCSTTTPPSDDNSSEEPDPDAGDSPTDTDLSLGYVMRSPVAAS